ncbi:MAG: 50S ribosomal protein L9 [Patescibacteria group bacterium]
MKVIFIKNVPNIGQKDQVKQVSDGFALNFLFPKQLAVAATGRALQQVAANQAKQAKQAEAEVKMVNSLKQKLQGMVVNLKAKASPSGTLYAAVSPEQVKQAIAKSGGFNLDKFKVDGCHNIKSVGAHTVQVNLPDGELVNLKIIIEVL